MVVGIDEVGRGPWAGPLVFGAVVLGGEMIDGLTDSKKLTKKKREVLDVEIRARALDFGLGWVSALEIDEVGLSAACTLACRRALEQIVTPYHEIIIDGTVNFLKDTGKGPYVTTMKQADLLVPSVSAASIVAKVARDKYMAEQDDVFPQYGFASHVGYGTKQHAEALQKYGITSLHRKSFAPVAELLGYSDKHFQGEVNSHEDSFLTPQTTRMIGNVSEEVAANYLRQEGFTVLERNWKTKACEIDIVARRDDTLYFVEVKHRTNDRQGGGLAAITAKKLQQMKLAARLYAHFIKDDNADMRLAVIATNSQTPEVTSLLVLE